MSFQDVSSYASRPPPSTGGGYQGGQRRVSIAQISDGLLQFQQNLTLLQRLVETRGPPEHVASQTQAVNDLAVRIGSQLTDAGQQLEQGPRDDTSLRVQHQKLSKDYQRVLQQFRAVEERARRQNRGAAAGGKRGAAAIGGGPQVKRDQATIEQDERLRVQMQQQAIDAAILQEREEEIREIHQNVTKVNEIFKDLADLVNDQQEEIDNVEKMIEKSHSHARSGLDQVEKANETSKGCSIS